MLDHQRSSGNLDLLGAAGTVAAWSACVLCHHGAACWDWGRWKWGSLRERRTSFLPPWTMGELCCLTPAKHPGLEGGRFFGVTPENGSWWERGG